MIETSLPTIGTVLITALIDSINPCAIGVLILLVSTLMGSGNKAHMLKLGMIYIGMVFLVYFTAGLGLIAFLANIPHSITEYIALAVGMLVVTGGLIEIKDFFWYGQGISLQIAPRYAKRIHELSQNLTTPAVMFLGAFVAGVELPCTGGPYLAITMLLSQNFNWVAILLLLIYNIIFVMPLIVILVLVLMGKKIHDIKQWKGKYKTYMRLVTGVVLIWLGWLLMLIANGTINLS